MLKPGSQLMFTAFEKLFIDEVYDHLDNGKWSKYDNRKAISPFYFHDDPFMEYQNLFRNLGFINCHFSEGEIAAQYSEKAYDGKHIIVQIWLQPHTTK